MAREKKEPCLECGAEMTSAAENFRYDASGLPNVVLLGVTVHRCPACGNFEVAIPRIEELHRVLAYAVAEKPASLTPAEIRFLRKYLGWSGADLARIFGVNPSTVSRWENGEQAIGPQTERLLRLAAVHVAPVREYPLEHLADVAQGEAKPIKLGLRPSSKGWEMEAPTA